MTNRKITFIDTLPATNAGAPAKYGWFAEALADNPGRWAEFPTQGSAATNGSRKWQIQNGRTKGFESGRYEATIRKTILYVRYIGDDQ